MWFVFGFVSFISFTFLFFSQRLKRRWSAGQLHPRRGAVDTHVARRKGRVRAAFIGIGVPDTAQFSLKPERWYDRLFKALGLSVEYQVGDAAFDRRVYIVSDDDKLCERLRADALLRGDVLAILKLADKRKWDVAEIAYAGGRLLVRYQPRRSVKGVPPELISQTGRVLQSMRVHLAPVVDVPRQRDPFVYRAAILLGISTALAVNGAVHLIRLLFGTMPFVVEPGPLLAMAMVVGVALTALLVAAVVMFLGRSARAHIVLFEIVTVGLFGAVATSFVELRDLNIELDRAPGAFLETTVVDKRIQNGRSDYYYLTVTPWVGDSAGASSRKEIEVSESLYDYVPLGDPLLVLHKPGFFNVPWVEYVGPRPP